MAGKMEFRTSDHPLAYGRVAHQDDGQWVARFDLETGVELTVRMGKTSWERFRRAILAEDVRLAVEAASAELANPTKPIGD